MVVEHRLYVLEPLQLGSPLVVVEPASKQAEGGHHQAANGCYQELKLIGDAGSPPEVKEARRDADPFKAAAHITVEDLLAKNGPDYLGAGLDIDGISQPSGVVRELSAVVVHAAQPNEDHRQVAEVRRKDLARDVF